MYGIILFIAVISVVTGFIVMMVLGKDIWLYKKLYQLSSKKLDLRAIQEGDIKLRVMLGEHNIQHEYVNPDSEEEQEERAWDDDYANGCMFVDGYSNSIHHSEGWDFPDDYPDPLKKKLREEAPRNKVKLIGKDRYKDYMQQDLVSQLVGASAGRNWAKLAVYLLMAVLALNVFIFLFV